MKSNSKKQLNTMISALYNDSYLIFSKFSSKKKKIKNKAMYNFLYEFVKTDVTKKKKRDFSELITTFDVQYYTYLDEKKNVVRRDKMNLVWIHFINLSKVFSDAAA